MKSSFAAYIASAKVLASERGLIWDLPCDETGRIPKDSRWDLTLLVGMIPPPSFYVGSFAIEADALDRLNEVRQQLGQPNLDARPIQPLWRDLYLAVIIHQLLVRKNKPASAVTVARWIRHLACAAGDTPPWAVTPEYVRQAYNAALHLGQSGKNALNFEMAVRTVFDDQHLADIPALARFCLPYRSDASRQAHERSRQERARVNGSSGTGRLRNRLAERKSEAKLPEQRAFWELVRIIFTETPQTFSDAIRFAVLKLLVISGLRIGEVVLLPYDWCRWREYVDADGQPAGRKGGVSRSLMIRHFAEKQIEDERADGVSLYENAQHVPPLFEDLVLETLADVATLTAPLRDRLRRQAETGRLFPEYEGDALVPANEMYTRATGNALFSTADVPADLVERYRDTFDPAVLDEIWAFQHSTQANRLPTAQHWLRLRGAGLLKIRSRTGEEITDRIDWREAFLRVEEVESYFRTHGTTKLPDLRPATLADGTPIHPHELLFLLPIRNLIEGRNGGILDVSRYFAAGRIATADIYYILDGKRPESIFRRYGATDEDHHHTLDPHALRHLQNTELFRLGVADTIITKRFNRRSVAQSYEYDHRSLAEDLAHVDVPAAAEEALGDNALQVYRMILDGKVSGPVVDEFRRIQRVQGDEVAFEYLNAEADGLHVTPYGLCVNSFTVDPCPKHLECFNGCRHLTRSDVDEERRHLERLRDRMAAVVDRLEAQPEDRRTAGWRNQIAHARIRLANIRKALATRPGGKPFPDGPDLSETAERRLGTTVLDTVRLLQESDD